MQAAILLVTDPSKVLKFRWSRLGSGCRTRENENK